MGDFRVKEGTNSREGFRQKYTQTIVFVSNLPPRLYWQGLWFAFARHGEVADAFNLARKSKKGYRLDRFSDNLEDRMCKQLKFRVSKNGESSKNQSKYIGDMSSGPRDCLKKPCLKRILGHVEEEAIRKLKRRFIGKTTKRCNTSQVEDRLLARGLKDVSVKFMGGCSFLIDLNAQELRNNMHLHELAILKEVFNEVNTWSDLFHSSERTTWIQVTGVPPHYWNLTKFKRRTLGEIEVLGKDHCFEFPRLNKSNLPMMLQTCKGAICKSNSMRLTEENEPIGWVNRLKASWAGIVSKNIGCQGDRAREDISHKLFRNAEMSFALGHEECFGSLERNPTIEDKANKFEGLRLSTSKGYEVAESIVNREENLIVFEDGVRESGSFPVPVIHLPCKPRRGKKFGHPIEIHSKILETAERKNLDHVKKKIMKGTKSTIHKYGSLAILDSKGLETRFLVVETFCFGHVTVDARWGVSGEASSVFVSNLAYKLLLVLELHAGWLVVGKGLIAGEVCSVEPS
ncbi:hypothetical protein V6N13_080497 [Hibiscus sabdariffa]